MRSIAARDRSLRASVWRDNDLPRFKSVREHQGFDFGICARANRGRREPRVTDFGGVVDGALALGGRPRPACKIEEPRRADHCIVALANNCKRDRVAALRQRKRMLDILSYRVLALRHEAPCVQLGIIAARFDQRRNVSGAKRFEPYVVPAQRERFWVHRALA